MCQAGYVAVEGRCEQFSGDESGGQPNSSAGGQSNSSAKPSSGHPSDRSGCMGKNSAHCNGICTWDFAGDWKTSCIPETCVGLNHNACDLHPKKCDWKWTGDWKTSCQVAR
uniref:Uncharacterized protein n=1 Tax=Zooxanthella nutricula TaxID=1333877 RepID=A0A7S2I0X9_9DINO